MTIIDMLLKNFRYPFMLHYMFLHRHLLVLSRNCPASPSPQHVGRAERRHKLKSLAGTNHMALVL